LVEGENIFLAIPIYSCGTKSWDVAAPRTVFFYSGKGPRQIEIGANCCISWCRTPGRDSVFLGKLGRLKNQIGAALWAAARAATALSPFRPNLVRLGNGSWPKRFSQSTNDSFRDILFLHGRCFRARPCAWPEERLLLRRSDRPDVPFFPKKRFIQESRLSVLSLMGSTPNNLWGPLLGPGKIIGQAGYDLPRVHVGFMTPDAESVERLLDFREVLGLGGGGSASKPSSNSFFSFAPKVWRMQRKTLLPTLHQ